jgi:hypothetical protein
MFVGQRELRLVIVVVPGLDVVIEGAEVVEEVLIVLVVLVVLEEDAWPVWRSPALPPLDGEVEEEGGTPVVTVTVGAVVTVVEVEVEIHPVL